MDGTRETAGFSGTVPVVVMRAAIWYLAAQVSGSYPGACV
jgi:hypothetical protein